MTITPQYPLTSSRQHELERLLDEMSCGTILDVDELLEEDLLLLQEAFGDEQDLQALIDRLRGGEGLPGE